MKKVVNVPYKSRWIGGMYIFITIFIALIYAVICFSSDIREGSLFKQTVFSSVMIGVFSLLLIILASFYSTKYKIKNGILTSWSPFMAIKIKLKYIRKVEKVMVPFHFRVGASFYSGDFYVPNVGWVRSIITNMRDAILITAKDGKKYMITPSNPKRFMKKLKS